MKTDKLITALEERKEALDAQIAALQTERQAVCEQLHFLCNPMPLPLPDLDYHEAVAAWQQKEEPK